MAELFLTPSSATNSTPATQVLSFALATEPAADDKMRRCQRDCEALIGGMAEVRVCSIVVLELLRGPPSVVAKIRSSGILDPLQVEAVDQACAEKAARILEAARGDGETCARCLNLKRATPCPACKQLVNHQQKTPNALIVATAALLSDVNVLYT